MAYNRSKFPEQYDIFEEKFDLPPRKQPEAEEWIALFNKGEDRDKTEDSRFKELSEELAPYITTPEDINYFQDAMTNVQKFFKEETQGHVDKLQEETETYVDNKKTEMNNYTDEKKSEIEAKQKETIDRVSQFNYKGIYQNDRQYKQMNTVKFRGNMYLALQDTIRNDPTNTAYWVMIAENGDKVNWRGTWTPITNYKHLDMVRYDGSVYVCELANYDKIPAINEQYWRIVIDNRDRVSSNHYRNFYDVKLKIRHNMAKLPQVQVVGYNGYGKGGFGMFGVNNRYNIPNIVEEINKGEIKIFITENIHGNPTITQVKENEFRVTYPDEQSEMLVYLY